MSFACGQTLCAGAQPIGAINRGQETAPEVILFDSLSLTPSPEEGAVKVPSPSGRGLGRGDQQGGKLY